MSSSGDTSSELSTPTDGSIEDGLNQARFPAQHQGHWALLAEWHLCSRCQKLLMKWEVDGDYLQLQPAKIRKSKDEGCQFCDVLCEAAIWAKIWTGDGNSQPEDRSEEDVWLETLSWSIIKLVSLEEVEPEIGCLISIGMDSASELPDHAIPGCPLSSEGLLFIRNQLENCVSNPGHDCEPPLTIEITRWPARVLEIYHNSVVLVDFDSDVMPGKFAALSYCWGSPSELQLKPPYKAVASTVQDLRSGISAAELPLTIQQALLVCKWLDIRYIWIDSLCILQDSAQDWETEATKMETVYSMSKVTIIAGSSTSCHSGFLGVDLHSVQLRTPLDASFQLTASTLCTSGFHKLKREGHPYDPLDTRGWTFQEEFLSSRYLKFTKDDIQWKCSAGSTCMCGQPASEDYHGLWGETHPTIINQRPWESLAEEFSHRGFTKDTDKLVAISSLAKKLAPEFPAPNGQAAYVAGLWRSKLVQQLSWYVFDKLGRCPDNYIAPSFSWASLNFDEGGISFAPILTHFFCRVLDVGTTLVFEGNEFGSVSSGYVSLQGPLISCAVLLRLDSGGCIEEPRLVIKQKMAPKLEVGATNFDCPLCERVLDTGCESLQRSRGLEHSAVGGFSAGLLILGQYDHGHLYCLILGQLNRNEYQRIGHVVLGYPGAKGKSVAKKFKAWRKDVRIS